MELYAPVAGTLTSAVSSGCAVGSPADASIHPIAQVVSVALMRLGRVAAAVPALQAAVPLCPLPFPPPRPTCSFEGAFRHLSYANPP